MQDLLSELGTKYNLIPKILGKLLLAGPPQSPEQPSQPVNYPTQIPSAHLFLEDTATVTAHGHGKKQMPNEKKL